MPENVLKKVKEFFHMHAGDLDAYVFYYESQRKRAVGDA